MCYSSQHMSFTFLVWFIPRYFIFGDVILKGNFYIPFLIFHCYYTENVTHFWMPILHPATLLNSMIRWNSFCVESLGSAIYAILLSVDCVAWLTNHSPPPRLFPHSQPQSSPWGWPTKPESQGPAPTQLSGWGELGSGTHHLCGSLSALPSSATVLFTHTWRLSLCSSFSPVRWPPSAQIPFLFHISLSGVPVLFWFIFSLRTHALSIYTER